MRHTPREATTSRTPGTPAPRPNLSRTTRRDRHSPKSSNVGSIYLENEDPRIVNTGQRCTNNLKKLLPLPADAGAAELFISPAAAASSAATSASARNKSTSFLSPVERTFDAQELRSSLEMDGKEEVVARKSPPPLNFATSKRPSSRARPRRHATPAPEHLLGFCSHDEAARNAAEKLFKTMEQTRTAAPVVFKTSLVSRPNRPTIKVAKPNTLNNTR